MRETVRQDLSRSAAAFRNIVWPQIAMWFGGGHLETVEAVTASQMAKDLDILAGIDAWHIDGAVRGIASRIQYGIPYNTFTVRMKRSSGIETEYAKRLQAIESDNGWLYPHITVQAYIDHDILLSAAACRTADLIRYIRDNLSSIKMKSATDNGNSAEFAIVTWEDLKQDHGVKIFKRVET